MTEPAIDLAKSILALVGKFVSSLPADQLTALAAGEARLAVIPKGARVSAGPAAGGGARKADVSAFQVADDLAKIDDRPAAARYIDDLKLTVPQLRKLSAELGVALAGKAGKAEIVRSMVEVLVGRRADAQSIGRHSSAARV